MRHRESSNYPPTYMQSKILTLLIPYLSPLPSSPPCMTSSYQTFLSSCASAFSYTASVFGFLCVRVCLCPCEVKSNMNQYERRERSAAILVPSRPTQEVHMQSNNAASLCDVWSLLEYSNFCSLCWCDFVEQEVKGTSSHYKVKPRRSEDNNVRFAFLRFCFNCPEFYYIWGKLLQYRLDHLSGFKRIKMFKIHCFV